MYEKKLNSLAPGGSNCYIVIKILRLWDCIIPPSNIFMGTDFLAVDSEGSAMHGCIPVEIAGDFSPMLGEGKIYAVSIFEVIGQFPQYHFCFASYYDIVRRDDSSYHLTDIVSILEAVTDVSLITLPNNKGRVFKRDLFILISGHKIRITLWDSKTHDLDMTPIFRLKYQPVLAIAGLNIWNHSSQRHINTCSATKFYIDPDIQETTQLRRRSFPYNGSFVTLVPASEVGNHYFVYSRFFDCNMQQDGIIIPVRSVAMVCSGQALVINADLRISFIINLAGFNIQAVVFGTLAYRLTGVDITMLDLAERMNFRKIPTVAEHILNKEYDFILGILNCSYGPTLTYKIFRFLPLEE
ncbi:Nucleic acid-binding protein [Corchorus olitorius]|uniref:Nucleic acid-binding protein n=1 Tax=Corchorus olitorius TaxID=93759 RepID=A0A1R3I190_9ROSI|nr:Nucleic acid-binding protein [Corchorus olitorius]